MSHLLKRVPISVLALLPTLSGQAGAAGSKIPTPTGAEIQCAGGNVAVRYFPLQLGRRTLESSQERGTVWSMSDREAAVLETSVALVADGHKLIPPGRYRMSTWFEKRGVWHLLVFSKGKNYRSGTPYTDVALRLDGLDRPVETLKIDLKMQGSTLDLSLWAGGSRLRATFVPLAVQRQKTLVVGHPATYEFYGWPAAPEIQARIRAFEPIQFGRLRHDMPFGVVYEVSCRSDGKGVFIDAKTRTLRDNRDLLAETTRQLSKAGENAKLARRIDLLRKAITVQEALQTNVMIAGDTVTKQPRIPNLRVQAIEVPPKAETPIGAKNPGKAVVPIRGFVLGYGLRRVHFSVSDDSFKRLRWR